MLVDITNIMGSAREIQRDGTWFRDSKNRYLLFRGVNLASRSKMPPYLPILPLNITRLDGIEIKLEEELNSLTKHFDTMKELGFNIVRLLIMWKAIEPIRNEDPKVLSKEGTRYLECIKKIIDVLYARGIFVIIDFHQDVAHEVYDGDGFPDWILEDTRWLEIFHSNTHKNKMWQMQYMVSHVVKSTLRDFWLNKEPLFPRTHLEQTIGATARFFQSLNDGNGHPAILGYELFNEPHPVGFDKDEFETYILHEYYQNTILEIRSNSKKSGDDDSFIFVEPRIDSTIRSMSDEWFELLNFMMELDSKFDPSKLKDQKIVLSFHYYDPLLFIPLFPKNLDERSDEWKKIFKEITTWIQSKNVIPFLSEFGADQSWKQFQSILPSEYTDITRAVMNEQYQYVEENLLNATYWNYDFYNTETGFDNWNLEDFSILGPQRNLRNEDIVARPYPMRSSAKPISLSFDLNTKLCKMTFDKLESHDETMIYIPYGIHYKNGFDVYATSGNIRFDKENNLMFWNMTNSKKYEIIICPRNKFKEFDALYEVHKNY